MHSTSTFFSLSWRLCHTRMNQYYVAFPFSFLPTSEELGTEGLPRDEKHVVALLTFIHRLLALFSFSDCMPVAAVVWLRHVSIAATASYGEGRRCPEFENGSLNMAKTRVIQKVSLYPIVRYHHISPFPSL